MIELTQYFSINKKASLLNEALLTNYKIIKLN